MIATLGFVFGLAAFLISTYQVALRLIRKTGSGKPADLKSYISADVLGDQRSFLQTALRTVYLGLESNTEEARDPAWKVVRLLTSAPALAASPVISDKELANYENSTEARVIWIVSSDRTIEFAFPAIGGEFTAIVARNVRRGIQYRYLIADSLRARRRRSEIVGQFEGIQIRLFDRLYWSDSDRAIDEYVVYTSSDNNESSRPVGYYLYPGSKPRRWIKMDDQSADSRLHDAEAQWALGRQ